MVESLSPSALLWELLLYVTDCKSITCSEVAVYYTSSGVQNLFYKSVSHIRIVSSPLQIKRDRKGVSIEHYKTAGAIFCLAPLHLQFVLSLFRRVNGFL